MSFYLFLIKQQQVDLLNFFDRQIGPNLKIWPLPENSTDVVIYDALTRIDDA